MRLALLVAIALLLLVPVMVATSPKASAMTCCNTTGGYFSGYLQGPWLNPITWFGQKSVGAAGINDWVGPTASTWTGHVRIDIGAWAAGAGASNALAQAGFWSGWFQAPDDGLCTFQVGWAGSFEAAMATAIGVFGTSHAGGSAIFSMNVFDGNTGEYVFGGYPQVTVYNPPMIDDGIVWADNDAALSIVLSGSGHLIAGHWYAFETYLEVGVEADAVGLVDATSVGNFGSGGAGPNFAVFTHADYSCTVD